MSSYRTSPGGQNGTGTHQTIINHMPPHDVSLEPFLGSGAVWIVTGTHAWTPIHDAGHLISTSN